MFILEREMPNGALAKYHRAGSFLGVQDGTQVLVDSFHKEDMVLISWRDTYTLPPDVRIGNLADAEAALVAAGRAFAGAEIVDAAVGDLAATRIRLRAVVCDRAEATRNLFLTPGSGQAITYTRKEVEARAWRPGADPASAPFLAAEAAATGETIDSLAATVVAQADAWVAVGSAIEARRRGLLTAIDQADTPETLAAIEINSGRPEPAA